MSKNSKIVLWVIIILILIGLVSWIYASQNRTDIGEGDNYNNGAMIETTTTNTTISSTTTSNDDLNQDMTKVDTQMNGLDSDSAAVDQDISNP